MTIISERTHMFSQEKGIQLSLAHRTGEGYSLITRQCEVFVGMIELPDFHNSKETLLIAGRKSANKTNQAIAFFEEGYQKIVENHPVDPNIQRGIPTHINGTPFVNIY